MSILKAISYFSIFEYPLTFDEIFRYSDKREKSEIANELLILEEQGVIYNHKGYYSSIDNMNLVTRRLKGNRNANNIMPKAWKIAKLISKFPYIESVCVSGSLSKGYFDEKSDIDFFIIAKKNRLWIARTLLILYKKIFLLNSKKHFCLNYFMSSGYLKVDEENRFTATEIVTLIPLYGGDVYQKFMKKNKWVYDFFPNYLNNGLQVRKISKGVFVKMLEIILATNFGTYLERYFMKITIKKWNHKFNHLSKKDFEIAFKSSENISKHHPSNFQKKILTLLNEKYLEIEEKHNIKLDAEYA